MDVVTKDNYEKIVGKGNVILDFWAPWCGPCKTQSPILDAIQKEANHVTIAKLNVDDEPGLASDNDVRGIPTLVFFKDGEMVDKHSGVLDKASLVAKISRHFS